MLPPQMNSNICPPSSGTLMHKDMHHSHTKIAPGLPCPIIRENATELFDWYWQPSGSLNDLSPNVAIETTEAVLDLGQIRENTEALCDEVKEQHEAYNNQLEGMLAQLQQK